MPIREINGIAVWQSELFRENVIHGFTCRKGGVSSGEYASLSMSPRRGDDPAAVRKNEEILCQAMGLNISRLTSTAQEHTNAVEIIDGENAGRGIQYPWSSGVDGIITLVKGVPLLAYAADCVPILLYAEDIEAVAAVHSGWRGTEGKIALNAVEKLRRMGARPEKMTAVIGPAIGRCCYEVSEDVALRFPSQCRDAKGGGKYMLDLKQVNELMLRHAGVGQIDNTAPCTMCRNDLFFSHRGQGGKSGTLAAFIELRNGV